MLHRLIFAFLGVLATACASGSQLDKLAQQEIIERQSGGILLAADIACSRFDVTFRNTQTEAIVSGVLRRSFLDNGSTEGVILAPAGTYQVISGQCESVSQGSEFVTTVKHTLLNMEAALPDIQVQTGGLTYPGTLTVSRLPKGTIVAEEVSVERRLKVLSLLFVSALEVRLERELTDAEIAFVEAVSAQKFREILEVKPAEDRKARGQEYVAYGFENRADEMEMFVSKNYEQLKDLWQTRLATEDIAFPFGRIKSTRKSRRIPSPPRGVAQNQKPKSTGRPRARPPSSFKPPPPPRRPPPVRR